MTDSIDTSEREAEEPRMLRLPVVEMAAEPAPPPVAAGYEPHPVGTGERIRFLERVNAELVAQNEAQKNEWLAWDAKRMSLERDAARYRWLRDKADEGKNWEPMVFSCSSRAPINWADSLHGADLDAAVDAALTSATKEQQK